MPPLHNGVLARPAVKVQLRNVPAIAAIGMDGAALRR
jgi:hypothetical protein